MELVDQQGVLLLRYGNFGTMVEQGFISSFKGESGATGSSTFEVWKSLGNEGDEQDFINSLQGEDEIRNSAYESWINLGNLAQNKIL